MADLRTLEHRARPGRCAGPLAAAAFAFLGVAGAGAPAAAATPAATVHKTTLQARAFPSPGYDTLTIRTVVDRGGAVARHIHPGVEMGYVLSGQALLAVAGQRPRALAAGDSFSVPADTPHSLSNTGPGPLTVLSTYVVDRARPIMIPAP